MRREFHTAVMSGLLAMMTVVVPSCMAQQPGNRQYGQPEGYHGGFVSTPGRIPMGAPQPMGLGQHILVGSAPHFVMPYVAPMYGAGNAAEERGKFRHEPGRHHRNHENDGYGQGGYAPGYLLSPWGFANTWETLPEAGSESASGSGSSAASAADEQSPAQGALPSGYGNPPEPPPDGYRPAYVPGRGAEKAASVSAPLLAQEPQLTLIFKNGHRQTVRNYVLTPTTVIDLDEASQGRERQFPLADVNIAATQKAAEAAGLSFQPPA
jgi:hypothetical protein